MSTQNQIILEETFDENYQPTEEEILEYARTIDIDPETEPHLMWIAQEGILAHLPDDWRVCEDLTSGHIYYFNLMNGNSTWDHPCDDFYKKMAEGEREKHIMNNNIPAGKMEKDLIIMNKEKIEHNDSRLGAPKANFSPGLPSVHKTNKPLSNLAPLKTSGNVLASLQASNGQNVKSSLNLTGTSSKTGSVGVSNSRHFTSSMSIPVYSTEFEDEVEQGKEEEKKQINIQGDSDSESESEDYGKDVDFGIDKGLSEKIMDIENLDFAFRDFLEKDFDGTLSMKSTARDESGEKVSPLFLDVAGSENKRIQEILTPSPTPTPTSPSLGAAAAAKTPVVVVSTATANRLSSEEASKTSLPEEMKKTAEECSETDLESKRQEIEQKHEISMKELREKYEEELEKAKEEMREKKETKVKELKAIFLKEELREIERIEQEKENRIKSAQQELEDQLSKFKSENQMFYEKEKEKFLQDLNEKLEDILKQRRQSLKEKHQAETKEIEAKHKKLLEKLQEEFKEKEKQERKNFAEKLDAKQKEMREELQQKLARLKKELTAERERMEKQIASENASLREKLVNLQEQREELEKSTEELARKEKDFAEKKAKFLKNQKLFFEDSQKAAAAAANHSVSSENGSNSKTEDRGKEKPSPSPSPSSLWLGSTNLVNGNDSLFKGLGDIENVPLDDCAEGTFGSQPMPRALSSLKENQETSSLGSKPSTPVENAQKSPRTKVTSTHLPKSGDEKAALSSELFEELRVNLENINDKFKLLQSYIHPEQEIRSTWPKQAKKAGDNKETPYLKCVNGSRLVTFDPALDLELNTDFDDDDDDDDDGNGLDDTFESSSEDDSYNNLIKLLKSNQNAPAESETIPEAPQDHVNIKSKSAYRNKSTRAGDCLDNQYLHNIIGDLCAVIEETPVTSQGTAAINQPDWTNPVSHANVILQSRRSAVKQNKLQLSSKISSTKQVSWQHYSSNMPKSYFEVPKATSSTFSTQYVPAKDLLLELRRPTSSGGTVSVSDWLTEQRSHMQPVKPDQVPLTNITKFYTVDVPDQNSSYLNIGNSNQLGNNSIFNNNIGGTNSASNNKNGSIFEPLTLATPNPLGLSAPKLTSEAPKLKLDTNNQISIEKPLPFTLPC